VVLYASSQVDKRKSGARLAMAIQVAFQELGVFDTSNTHIPLSDMEAIPFSNVQAVENVGTHRGTWKRVVQPMKGILAPTSTPTPLERTFRRSWKKRWPRKSRSTLVDIKPKKRRPGRKAFAKMGFLRERLFHYARLVCRKPSTASRR